MHTIDLEKYGYRTDLIIENEKANISNNYVPYKGIKVSKSKYNDNNYITISFEDVTDKDNYKRVEEVFIKELKEVIGDISNKKIMVIGLGNVNSTPDALGPSTIDNVLVTRHLFNIGDVEEGYANVCSFKPSVTGVTGIETGNLVLNLVSFLKVDLVIVIDALAARSISRVNKTIQITDSGISPGSGVGNYREEISYKKLGIPVNYYKKTYDYIATFYVPQSKSSIDLYVESYFHTDLIVNDKYIIEHDGLVMFECKKTYL